MDWVEVEKTRGTLCLRKMILKIIFSLMASNIFKAPGTQLLMKVLSLLPLSSAPLKTAKYMLWLDGMY